MRSIQIWSLGTAASIAVSLTLGCAAGSDAEEGVSPHPIARPHTGPSKADDGRQVVDECGDFPAYYMEFLDDTRCQKSRPSDRNRDLQCPVVATGASVYSPHQDKPVHYAPATAEPLVDETALMGIVPDDMNLTLVLVRRVNGEPHYRYLSNGTHDVTVQPWSSTKFMAVANAGANLRAKSNGLVGLTGRIDGHPLGDLSTIVHNYDEREFRSNALARWFLNVGDRDRLDRLVHGGWLDRPSWETLGGNYGAAGPGLGYEIIDQAGSVSMAGTDVSGRRNQLSTFTIAEFLKRLVMHREDPQFGMPDLDWDDIKVLLYGAAKSRRYDRDTPQGMESDTAIYLEAGLDMAKIEAQSNGQWRIFSKLGFGTSRGGEFVNAGYACLPVLGDDGAPKPNWGKEFFLVTQLSGEGDFPKTDARLAEVYGQLVRGIMSGEIK